MTVTHSACAGMVVTLVGLLLSVASAWACVPQPFLSVSPGSSGAVGAQVMVEGSNFGLGGVEIRWDGVQGALLAEGEGKEFSLPVKIPDAPPGLHYMLGINRGADGSIIQKGAVGFDVIQAGGAASSLPADSGRGGKGQANDKSGVSAVGIAGLAVGSLIIAVLGGVVGAVVSARRSSRTVSTAGTAGTEAT